MITGRDIQDARPGSGESGQDGIDFTLTADAAQRFGSYTEANIGSRLAIVLDERIQSVPIIQSRIDGSGRISGNMTRQEAADLALILRSGALPAGILMLEER